jgi:hypothetical protein
LIPLPDALRALPLATPPAGGWAQLAASLAQSQPVRATVHSRSRRYALPVALAAAVVATFVTTLALRAPHAANEPARVAGTAAATKGDARASSVHNVANETNAHDPESLAAMQSRSHALEHWLRETGGDSAPQSAQDLAASAEIEDMIGMVDVQLADQSEDDASLPLWRRRVALLEDLATLRYGANMDHFKAGLLASETTDARHATWNN